MIVPGWLCQAKQHGKKGEQADADEENGDGDNRRLLPSLVAPAIGANGSPHR